jgi:hypothetical protein
MDTQHFIKPVRDPSTGEGFDMVRIAVGKSRVRDNQSPLHKSKMVAEGNGLF